jgi:uncharacterized protein YjlB
MKRISCLIAGLWLIALPHSAWAQVTFKFVTAGQAAEMVSGSKPPDGLAADEQFSMTLRKRVVSSHVEKHMGWNEELVIQEGTVLLNYGGDATNARQIAPGEFNGDAITGGKSVVMHPGDIVILPAGTWHEQVLQTPVMRYILFKTTNKSPK